MFNVATIAWQFLQLKLNLYQKGNRNSSHATEVLFQTWDKRLLEANFSLMPTNKWKFLINFTQCKFVFMLAIVVVSIKVSVFLSQAPFYSAASLFSENLMIFASYPFILFIFCPHNRKQINRTFVKRDHTSWNNSTVFYGKFTWDST